MKGPAKKALQWAALGVGLVVLTLILLRVGDERLRPDNTQHAKLQAPGSLGRTGSNSSKNGSPPPGSPIWVGNYRAGDFPEPAILEDVPSGQSTISIVVRDLGTGDPIPAIDLALGGAATKSGGATPSKRVMADSSGVMPFPREGEWRLVSTVPGWHMVSQSAAEIRSVGEAWAYRMITASGTVRAQEGLDRMLESTSIALNIIYCGDSSELLNAEPRSPLDWRWLRQRGLSDQRGAGKVNEAGEFTMTIPAIRGTALQVVSPGWRAESMAVSIPPAVGEDAHFTFRLRPATKLKGGVYASDGSPLGDVTVAAYITVAKHPEEVDVARLILDGHSVKAIIGHGKASVTYVADVKTQADGAFELNLNVDGEVLLTAYAKEGYLPLRVHLGNAPKDDDTIDLRPVPVTQEQEVQVTVDGLLVPGHSVSISDFSVGDAQPTFLATLNNESRMLTGLLEEGHSYTVVVHPTVPPGKLHRPAIIKELKWGQGPEIRLLTNGE